MTTTIRNTALKLAGWFTFWLIFGYYCAMK